MKRFSILVFAVLLGFASCTSDKPAEEVSPVDTQLSFYLRYLETDRKVKAIAETKIENAEGKMEADSFQYNIWIQGRPLELLPENTRPGYYMLEMDYAQPGQFEFVFEDKNGDPESYSFDLLPGDSISIVTFRDSQGLELQFSKTGLSEDESLIIVATDQQNASASATVNGPKSGTITVPADTFGTLQPGPLTLYLVRKTRINAIHESGRKYTAELEYYFKDLRTTFEKTQ